MKRTLTLLLVAFAFIASVNAQSTLDNVEITPVTAYESDSSNQIVYLNLNYDNTTYTKCTYIYLELPAGITLHQYASQYINYSTGGVGFNNSLSTDSTIVWGAPKDPDAPLGNDYIQQGQNEVRIILDIASIIGNQTINYTIQGYDASDNLATTSGSVTIFEKGNEQCDIPTDITVTPIDTGSVSISWTSDASLFNIKWGHSPINFENALTITGITESPYILSKLNAEKTYEFHLQANCGTSESEWSEKITFTTPAEGDPISISAIQTLSNVSIYPNPSNGVFNVAVSTEKASVITIEVMNTQGQVVYRNEANAVAEYRESINLEGFAKGVYCVKVNTGNKVNVSKVIVR